MHGYKVLKNVIPSTYLNIAQKETLRLKTWLLDKDLVGTRSELGTGTYWRGIETAGRLSRALKQMYESPFMLELAREELGYTFYMYNDQVVVKMPKEPLLSSLTETISMDKILPATLKLLTLLGY